MNQSRLDVNILIPLRFADNVQANAFIDLITRKYASLKPKVYGNVEPLRRRYDGANPGELLDAWGDTFVWQNDATTINGMVSFAKGPRPIHTHIGLSVNDNHNLNLESVGFLKESSSIFNADFSSLHRVAKSEVESKPPRNTIFCLDPGQQLYSNNVTTWDLVKFVPNLAWATVFGKPYVDLFGLDQLLSAPAPVVETLNNGSVYIQLSDSPFDFDADYDKVDAIRTAVKRHLNHDAFYDKNKPPFSKYNVPRFEIEGYSQEDMERWHGPNAPEDNFKKMLKSQGVWRE